MRTKNKGDFKLKEILEIGQTKRRNANKLWNTDTHTHIHTYMYKTKHDCRVTGTHSQIDTKRVPQHATLCELGCSAADSTANRYSADEPPIRYKG